MRENLYFILNSMYTIKSYANIIIKHFRIISHANIIMLQQDINYVPCRHKYIECEHKIVSYTSAILSLFVFKSLIRFLLHISTPLLELILTIDKIYKSFLKAWNESFLYEKNRVFFKIKRISHGNKSFRLFILKLFSRCFLNATSHDALQSKDTSYKEWRLTSLRSIGQGSRIENVRILSKMI